MTTEETVAKEATEQSTPAEPVSETSEWEKKAQEFMLGWQRERAEFQNYRKRAETQIRESGQSGAIDALLALLPVIDDFERAIANMPAALKEDAWANGVSGIYRKFQKLLEDRGVTVLDPQGQLFDPNKHEAVATEDSDSVPSGHVTVTLQRGYAFGERVLRSALVRVAN